MSKLTKDDKMVWKYATRGVKKSAHIKEQDNEDNFTAPESFTSHATPAKPPARITAKPRELIEGGINYTNAGNFEKLRKGKLRPEARLDLHGYKIDEAKEITADFIRHCHQQHKRCILIITGKSGVIKKEFAHWLNLPEISGHILTFTTATMHDGGEGAYYLLLKK